MSATLLIMLSSLIKVKQRSHANHTMRGLRYTWLILERLGFPLALTQTLHASSGKSLFTSANIWSFFKSLNSLRKNSQRIRFRWPPTRNTCKIANKFMTLASQGINLQKQRSHLSGIVKVKAARSAPSMADVIPFLAHLIFPSNPTLR